VQITDDIVVRSGEMTKEEIVQEVIGLALLVALPLRIELSGSAGGRGIVGSKVDYH